jgi:prophage regulatory protein
MQATILRLRAVLATNGLSKSTLYSRIENSLWTRPVSLGPRAVGWPAAEVEALNTALIAGKTPDEIVALVARLHNARRAGR